MEVSKNEDHLFQWGIGLVSSSCYPHPPTGDWIGNQGKNWGRTNMIQARNMGISQGTLGDWTDSTGRLDSTKETGDRKSLREELGGKTSLDSNKKEGDGMSAMVLYENVVNQNIAIKWWTWWLTKPHFYLCSLIWFQGSNRNPPIFAARRCCKWTRLLADGAVRTWWKSSNGWRTQSFFQMADSWMMGWIEIPMI